jgi:hypothetical protein
MDSTRASAADQGVCPTLRLRRKQTGFSLGPACRARQMEIAGGMKIAQAEKKPMHSNMAVTYLICQAAQRR